MPEQQTSTLSSSETARYSRHILLNEIGTKGQEALKNAKVLVIGAGGLGSPVAMYLAAAGIGTLGIADFDTIELHNLQRQIIHDTDKIGESKAQSSKDRIHSINPHVNVVLHEQGIKPDNAIQLFDAYDIVVDGTDNFGTRYLNNDASVLSKTPLVYGSIFKFEGQVSLFDPNSGGPCYRCLFPTPPPPGSVPSCGEAGVMGALCGIIGSMQALEAIKFITKTGTTLNGNLLVVDTLNSNYKKLKLKPDSSCPVCSSSPSITSIEASRYQYNCETETTETNNTMDNYPPEIDVNQTKELLAQDGTFLLDVREGFELDICKIDGSVHIPMNDVPNNLDKLPTDKHILVQCHHGGRSRNVMNFLHDNGFDKVSNVSGGIDAWAVNLDPSMQRY